MIEETTKRQPKYRLVERELLSMINDGKVGVGQQVPTEHSISQKYAVSRFTVRKAIENLEQKGYVTRTPGRGTFVTNWRIAQTRHRVLRKDIALIAVDSSADGDADDSWTVRSLHAAADEAEHKGYHITFCGVTREQILRGQMPLAIRERTVNGGIIDGYITDRVMKRLLEYELPYMLLGSHVDYHVPAVDFDIEDMNYKITTALLDLNHGPVWYISDEPDKQVVYMQQLYRGYKRGIFEYPGRAQVLRGIICKASECRYVVRQMAGSAEKRHCLIVATQGHLRAILRHIKAEGISREDLLIVGIGRYHSGWPLSREEMMFCDVRPDELAREAVRELIDSSDNGREPIKGRKFRLRIEKADDAVRPLRFEWK